MLFSDTTTINVQWSAEVWTFDSYQLAYTPSDGDKDSPLVSGIDVRQAILTSLTPGQLYTLELYSAVAATGITKLSDSTRVVTGEFLH